MATVQDEMERMQTIADRMKAQIRVLEEKEEAAKSEVEAAKSEAEAAKVNLKRASDESEQFQNLVSVLLKSGRTEELLRAVEDPVFRAKLEEELL
ncbi:MAG: hypothetical protein MRZ97_01380 [Firmicutes bacterium]|nr:hypothetical protein [Bacillota bacterium]